MNLHAETIIARNPAAIETTVGSEIVLMLIASGQCFGLGETGSDVWRQIAEPASLSTVISRLRELYEAPAGDLEGDLHELLEQWDANQLIVLS